jgi:site-specific recombinase XerD
MKLSICLHQFFDQYLPRIKGASDETINSYRQSFTLFLKFAAVRQKQAVKDIQVEHLTTDLIFDFLNHLEEQRKNVARTRNSRLAAIKSLAKMIRLLYQEYRKTAEMLLNIPQKRWQKPLIGFLTHDEVLKVLGSVDLKRKDGFRDYTLMHLLYDSGCRASELAALKIDYFDPKKRTLAILGKGNRYRQLQLWPKTAALIEQYIKNYRPLPKPLYEDSLFINQRKESLTRHGIYRICEKYLNKSLPGKKLNFINPVHSFRHSCAVNMLMSGASLTEIKNHLGHEKLGSTMIYLHLNLPKKRDVQKRFIEYTQSNLNNDTKINELIDWKNKEKTLNWLDSL